MASKIKVDEITTTSETGELVIANGVGLDCSQSTGIFKLPKGTDAQRPSSSNLVGGELRFNTEDNRMEFYNGTEWFKMGPPPFSLFEDSYFSAFITYMASVKTSWASSGTNYQYETDSSDDRIQIGASQDLSLFHNGTHSFINNSQGTLVLQSDALSITNEAGNSNRIVSASTGNVSLCFSDSVKLKTTGSGVDITDTLNVVGVSTFTNLTTFSKSGSALRLNDGSILRLGNADADFFIYHDGSSTDYISAGAGKQLRLTTDDFIIKGANNTETLMSAAKDGGVYLYHNNIVRAETTANGFQITNGTLDFANNSGSGASLRNYSAGVFFVGNAAQGDLSLYCQDNTNNSIILQANTGEKYIECNMGGSVDLWYHGGLVAKTTQRGLRLTSNLASSGGMANMLQLDNTGNNSGDGSKITFSRAGTIRSEIESIKNETANNETDIVFRNTNAGSLYERLRIFGDGSITQNYANPNASAVFRISKSGAGAAELRFDTATVNTANLQATPLRVKCCLLYTSDAADE